MPELSGIYLCGDIFLDQLFNAHFLPVVSLNSKPFHALQLGLMRFAFYTFNNHIMVVAGKESDEGIH